VTRRWLAIIVLAMLASLLVAGCTNSTSTPTATATPKDTEAKVAYLESYLILQGYTTALKVVGNTDEGYLMYHGNASKSGMQYTVSVIETDSRSNAMSEFNRSVNWSVRFGFVGDYINATSWQGTMTDKGTLFTTAVLVIDDKWVAEMFGE
jgi:hypothetical protein